MNSESSSLHCIEMKRGFVMKKRLFVLMVGVLLVFALVACQESKQETKELFIAPPVKALEWGMTIDEVQSALSKAGVETTVNESTGSCWIDLTADDAAALGLETVAGMNYNSNSPTPIAILFLADNDGLQRFTSVQVDVNVPTEEKHLSLPASQDVMNEALKKVYGDPVGDAARWGTSGKTLTKEDAAKLSGEKLAFLESNNYDAFYVYPMLHYTIEGVHNLEATLLYNASDYVHLIDGNF